MEDREMVEAQAEFDRYCEETKYDYYEELADQHFVEHCERNGINPEDFSDKITLVVIVLPNRQ